MIRAMLGLMLMAAGGVLIVLGLRAHDSFASSVTRLVSGSPTQETVLLLSAGAAAACAGLVVALAPISRRPRARRR